MTCVGDGAAGTVFTTLGGPLYSWNLITFVFGALLGFGFFNRATLPPLLWPFCDDEDEDEDSDDELLLLEKVGATTDVMEAVEGVVVVVNALCCDDAASEARFGMLDVNTNF